MHWYRVDFTFNYGGSSYIDVFSPEKVANPTPFDLVDFNAANIDLMNVLMLELKYLSREFN